MLYQMVRGVEVEEVALDPHPFAIKARTPRSDGLVLSAGATEAQGLIEIKSPLPAAHLNTLLTETISEAHLVQMQWQLACTGRAWCDFVSFNPDFPPAMQMWIKRVNQDAKSHRRAGARDHDLRSGRAGAEGRPAFAPLRDGRRDGATNPTSTPHRADPAEKPRRRGCGLRSTASDQAQGPAALMGRQPWPRQ